MQFKKGVSGNALGRPKKLTTAQQLRQSIADNLPDIITVLIQKNLDGDVAAAKLLLDRALPTLKPEAAAVTFDIASNDKLSDVGQSIIDSVSRGDIAPDTSNAVMAALTAQAKIVETLELIERIELLEEQSK